MFKDKDRLLVLLLAVSEFSYFHISESLGLFSWMWSCKIGSALSSWLFQRRIQISLSNNITTLMSLLFSANLNPGKLQRWKLGATVVILKAASMDPYWSVCLRISNRFARSLVKTLEGLASRTISNLTWSLYMVINFLLDTSAYLLKIASQFFFLFCLFVYFNC